MASGTRGFNHFCLPSVLPQAGWLDMFSTNANTLIPTPLADITNQLWGSILNMHADTHTLTLGLFQIRGSYRSIEVDTGDKNIMLIQILFETWPQVSGCWLLSLLTTYLSSKFGLSTQPPGWQERGRGPNKAENPGERIVRSADIGTHEQVPPLGCSLLFGGKTIIVEYKSPDLQSCPSAFRKGLESKHPNHGL